MATAGYKEPVEDDYDDDDEKNDRPTYRGAEQGLRDGTISPEVKTFRKSLNDIEDLKSQMAKLESSIRMHITETSSTQDETLEILKTRLAGLEKEMRIATEGMKSAEEREREARTLAVDMAHERTHMRDELAQEIRDKATIEKNFQELLKNALKIADDSRAELTAEYESVIGNLKEILSDRNDTIEAWEEEIERLQKENDKLRKDNEYYKETLFTVSPIRGEEQSDNFENRQALLDCFSCGQSYSPEVNSELRCSFHPLPGVPRSVWRRWSPGPGDIEYSPERHARHLYWSCCNTLSASRPPGCCQGVHHQSWEMDLRMKQVMMSPIFLDKIDKQNSPLTIL